MEIQLSQLMPIPLQDKLLQRNSDIWNKEVTFQQGTFVKIKAPSGSGKTTLIHYLYNIRYDYTGQIRIDRKPWPSFLKDEISAIRQQSLSIIFQDLRLFDQLTAKENVELKRVMIPEPFCTSEKVEEMAHRLKVAHVLKQSGKTLSYGERQRIAIIRALSQPFKWLLMDEPFSHLDEENTKLAARLIAEECKSRNAGFILTDLDHDQHFSYDVNYNL
ncbi:ATP-binding cassette domain-containing protein [Chitinophaga silvatica]|uniref:ATP-binding cassette domain-containing protein n=1 Tax=Chitinophaga silvatica TaxID=2282649 RepID=A0A3E1YBA1_9BACT|nr:ATP-binding cassette domain-containing protein [Chitinophaga silvatica]RFS23332.1 ATP-binding cassette domain-containing protein [Chitinophaga silvatica]